MNIHEFVDDMKERFETEIRHYIQEILASIAKTLSEKHNIPENEIMDSMNNLLNHSTKKCRKITKQGHSCKYDAKLGEDFCIKHTNYYRKT